MPKKHDKSFDLLASIGKSKTPVELPPIEEKPTAQTKPQPEKKPRLAKKGEGTAAKIKNYSNIPYVPPSPEVRKQLKKLAFEEETTMTALISEGLDYVFKQRGLKTIQELHQ